MNVVKLSFSDEERVGEEGVKKKQRERERERERERDIRTERESYMASTLCPFLPDLHAKVEDTLGLFLLCL